MNTKYESMLKDTPAKTWSARMPAFCYTELCVVPGLRMHPADARRGHNG